MYFNIESNTVLNVKSAYVGVYQLLYWKMHGETLKLLHCLVTAVNVLWHTNSRKTGSISDW